jgi:hypothetical protein
MSLSSTGQEDVSLFFDFCDMFCEHIVFSDMSSGSTSRHQTQPKGRVDVFGAGFGFVHD